MLSPDGDFRLTGRLRIPWASTIIVNTAFTSAGRFRRSNTPRIEGQFQRNSGIGDRHRVDQFTKSGLAAVSDLTESCPQPAESLHTRNRFSARPISPICRPDQCTLNVR
jgi:hypothetical protein